MKILFFISSLNFGGAERVLSLISSALVDEFEVVIAKFDKDPSFFKLDNKVKLINLDIYKNGINLRSRVKKFFIIRRCIKDQNPDIVVSFMDNTNLAVIISSLFLNKKIFISEHTHHSYASKITKILRRILYPFASFLSVLTKEDLNYFYFVKNKEVIYNPMYKEIKNTKFNKKNKIIFVGRLEFIKGCDIFIDLIKELKDKLADFEILVVGDGSLKDKLKEYAKGLGIKFIGQVQDMDKIYSDAKILISTSRVEGLGNVLIESLFFDVIRISLNTSGAKELIKNNFDGIIAKDLEELKNGVLKVINDKEFASFLISNSKISKNKFLLSTIKEQYKNIFKRLR